LAGHPRGDEGDVAVDVSVVRGDRSEGADDGGREVIGEGGDDQQGGQAPRPPPPRAPFDNGRRRRRGRGRVCRPVRLHHRGRLAFGRVLRDVLGHRFILLVV